MTTSIRHAHLALVYATGVFYLTYALCNLYAHALHQITPLPNVAISLDSHIPFIAPMIVLYVLSWPLFLGSFYLVQARDLTTHTHRIVLVSIISAGVFYACPLVFSYERTQFDTWGVDWTWAYRLLDGTDKPYNQLPSLHVSFAILIFISLINTFKANRIIVMSLFLLCFGIAISTVFTYQHHLWDVAAGIIAAALVYYIDKLLTQYYTPAVKSCMVKYLALAVCWLIVFHSVPVIFGSGILWFYQIIGIYGFISFIIVVCCYHLYRDDNPIESLNKPFAKHRGRLSLLSHVLFLPLMMIYQLIWMVLKQRGKLDRPTIPISIQPNIDIIATNRLNKADSLNHALYAQYQHVIWLDMAAEISGYIPTGADYVYIPILDLADFDARHIQAISQYCQLIKDKINPDTPTLIVCQCMMGSSRSVGMMAFLLAYLGGLCADDIRRLIHQYYPHHHADIYLTDMLLSALTDKH